MPPPTNYRLVVNTALIIGADELIIIITMTTTPTITLTTGVTVKIAYSVFVPSGHNTNLQTSVNFIAL